MSSKAVFVAGIIYTLVILIHISSPGPPSLPPPLLRPPPPPQILPHAANPPIPFSPVVSSMAGIHPSQ